VQVLDPLDTLLVEDLRGRRSVEVEVSSKDLVGSFTGEDHLDTTGLDLSAATAIGRVVSNRSRFRKRTHDAVLTSSSTWATKLGWWSHQRSPKREYIRAKRPS
jgi:hypothetical protein